LINLITKRVMSMSTVIQASSTRGLLASASTSRRARPSWSSDEKRTKHRDDLANSKLILTILPTYIPPLSCFLNHDNVPRDFEYALVTAYILKGIRVVRTDEDKIAALKFIDFNLRDRKVYNMLAPHNYLNRTKGKNSKEIPQMNCAEGLQMNWVKYLVNQLELDCREAQDQGYEFHFSWLLILVTFIIWEMPEGVTFLDIEPFEPLATKFSTLWYSSDMNKKWNSNAMFHTYYNQLKISIQSEPCMMPNTKHRSKPLMKFNVDRHFIYITA
jgi:hypothetical protein